MAVLAADGEPSARGELPKELDPELELAVLRARTRAQWVLSIRFAIAVAPVAVLIAVFTAALASALL